MIEVLRNKNLTTRFQILAEIAGKGPSVQQRVIARELKITPQAVSDYIAQLVSEGMIVSEGRSRYRLTNQAVNWVIDALRQLDSYNTSVQRAINNISVCAAVADSHLDAGQKVGLRMQDGLLTAFTGTGHSEATGITVSESQQGNDVGITGISGIIPLTVGSVTVLKTPGIERGGSDRADYPLLENYLSRYSPVFAAGFEAVVALKRAGAAFQFFGASEAAAEAAKCGLNPLVVCADSESSKIIKHLVEARISYQMIDVAVND